MAFDKKSRRGGSVKPATNPAVRWIAAFVDYARTECHLSANTVAAYRRDLAKFAEWLAARQVTKLSIRDLADYAAWLHARGLAPASIARHVVSLKIFFRFLAALGMGGEWSLGVALVMEVWPNRSRGLLARRRPTSNCRCRGFRSRAAACQ